MTERLTFIKFTEESKFRKLEETADILTQGRVFKRPPTNFKDENYNV